MCLVRSLRRVALPALLLIGCLAPPVAHAQFGTLRKAVDGVARRLNPEEALRGAAPITTSLPDARWGVDSLDSFTPRDPKRSLQTLQRTTTGGFVLQPGYEFHDQSYCLQAGTHGPGRGDGYLYAPPLGPAQDAVTSVVRNSVQHPEIGQHDIQALLWAIIARAKFEDLANAYKVTARQLLTPTQLATLNRSALDFVPASATSTMLDRMPPLLRQVAAAEAELRQLLTTPGTSFEALERAAVLAGMAPIGAGSRTVPAGRWSLHPDGYDVRYLPQSYTNTVVELWVPDGTAAVGREYDAALHIAVPGNTGRQRLVQSGRAYAHP